jgi:hypothetical protein
MYRHELEYYLNEIVKNGNPSGKETGIELIQTKHLASSNNSCMLQMKNLI